MAAAAAAQLPGSVIFEAISAGGRANQRSDGAAGTVTVAHPAGLAHASAKLTPCASAQEDYGSSSIQVSPHAASHFKRAA